MQQPPSSPTKRSNLIRSLFPGVTPVDTATQKARWNPPQPINISSADRSSKVASMVKGYEAASLAHSTNHNPNERRGANDGPPARTYTPPAPASPSSPVASSPKVPAGLFQARRAGGSPAQARHAGAATTAVYSSDKENRGFQASSPPPSVVLKQRPVSSFHPQQTQQRQFSTESKPASDVSGATSAEHATYGVAKVVTVRPSTASAPAPPTSRPHLPLQSVPISTAPQAQSQEPQQPRRRQVSPTFTEILSFPSKATRNISASSAQPYPSSLQDKPLPAVAVAASSRVAPPVMANDGELHHTELAYRAQTRQRATTLSASDSRPTSMVETRRCDYSSGGQTPAMSREEVDVAFNQLLDSMQLPSQTVRTKMSQLEHSVKVSMLAASTSKASSRSKHGHQRALSASVGPSSGTPHNPYPSSSPTLSSVSIVKEKEKEKRPFLRKTKSAVSLKGLGIIGSSSRKEREREASSSSSSASGGASAQGTMSSSPLEAPEYWAVMLRSLRREVLEVKEVGKLRGRLRNESPAWVDEFIKAGGYTGLMERLKELLDVEWREEQHDDQLLFEILKCFKALNLTHAGRRALAGRSPTPFVALASLLFSEKRPGDLPCRQLLVELINCLFDIAPTSAAAITPEEWTGTPRRYTRMMKSGDDDPNTPDLAQLFAGDKADVWALVQSLMMGPPNEKEESKLGFIREAHRPRVFKKWITELSDCLRDYFWIFCHVQNQIWTYDPKVAEQVEAPKVPSGMTGGVEYEAMSYCTTHFKLINALAARCPTPQAAFVFHEALFESGFERIVLVLRRASTEYYPSLHMEIAHYVDLARSIGINLGPRILALLDTNILRPEEHDLLRRSKQACGKAPSGAPQLEEMSF